MKNMHWLMGLLACCLAQGSVWKGVDANVTENKDGLTMKTLARTGGVQQTLPAQKGRHYRFSCQLKGQGRAQMCIFDPQGTIYSTAVTLHEQDWQTVSLAYYAHQPSASLAVYSLETNPCDIALRNFTQTLLPHIQALADVAVSPMVFQAEDYCGNGKVQRLAGADDAKAVWGKRWYRLMDSIPVPRTSRPLQVWGRFKTQGDGQLKANLVSHSQVVSSLPLDNTGEWTWLAFPPLSSRAVLSTLSVTLSGSPQVQAWLDCLVVGTSPEPPQVVPVPSKRSVLAVGHRSGSQLQAGPFSLQGENSFAREQTQVAFSYDDDHLYATFTCQASCLLPLNNRLHEFKAAITTRDNPRIYTDDAVLLLLQPPASQQVYEFTVSASGALLDARCTAPNIWQHRDTAWQSHAKVTCARKDGAWTASLAIPLKDLKATPKMGEIWSFMAGRCEQSRGEKSALQPIRAGFHILDDFTDFILVDKVPDIALAKLPTFDMGRNAFPLKTSAPVEASTAITLDTGKRSHFHQSTYSLTSNGQFQVQWTIWNRQTGQTYWKSPTYSRQVQSQVITFPKGNQVTLNGRRIDSGATLSAGINPLTLKLPFQGTLKAGDLELKPQREQLTIMVDETYLWPNRKACGLWINQGGLQQLLFRPQGVQGFTLHDYTLYLDLPEGFQLVGASGYYKLWHPKVSSLGPVKLGKHTLHRYAIRLHDTISSNKQLRSHQYIMALIRAPKTTVPADAVMAYHAGSPSQGIVEVPQVLKIHTLPQLAGKQPKDLIVQMWTGWLPSLDDPALRAAFGQHFRDMGVTETGSVHPETKNFQLINFEDWNLNLAPYIKQHPDHCLVDQKGQRSKQFVCTTVLLSHPEFHDYLRTAIADWLKRRNFPHHVNWDYESNVKTSYLSCFCPRCLKAFGSPHPLQKLDAWIPFMNRRMAMTAKLFRDTIKGIAPNTTFSVYSGYQNDESKLVYGIDWAMLAPNIDHGMCGYGRTQKDLDATRNALGKTPLVLGEIAYPYNVSERNAPINVTAPALLRRAADASKGILIYTYATLDARSFHAIATVSTIMARHEDFFLKSRLCGQNLQLPGWSRVDYEVLDDGNGGRLLLLMNDRKATKTYQATFPGFQTEAGSVPAGGVKAILLRH